MASLKKIRECKCGQGMERNGLWVPWREIALQQVAGELESNSSIKYNLDQPQVLVTSVLAMLEQNETSVPQIPLSINRADKDVETCPSTGGWLVKL